MELLIIIGIIMVLSLVLGYSFLPIIMGILWIIEFLMAASILFFAVMGILAIFSRKKPAVFGGIEKGERAGGFAMYEIEGEEYRNTFPTDVFLERLLYRKEKVNIRFLKIDRVAFVFDRVSLIIIGIGFPVFTVMAVALLGVIY